MSSMSFIEQSQQIQRSQRTQSPTANILQAGSDCSCNSSSHSLIAQSQKVGCGCDEGGTLSYDNSSEDSMPPEAVFETADGRECRLVFSHKTTESATGPYPDRIIFHYKLDCIEKDGGGTSDGGPTSGPRGFVPASGNGTVLGINDLFGKSGYQEPKVCLTCELINEVYDELFNEVKTGKKGIYNGLKGKAYTALYEFMFNAMSNIRERVYHGDLLNLDNQYGEEDDLFFQDYFDLFNKLDIMGNLAPENNIYMKYYLLEMLEKLKDCPKQLVVKLNRKMNNNIFDFVNLNDIPNDYLDKYGEDSHEFVEEKNGTTRVAYGSIFSIGQNNQAPCEGGYSFYKWTPFEGGESAWGRQNNRYFF